MLAAVLFDGLALRGYAFLLFDAPAVPAVAPDAITGIEGTGSRCHLVHLPQNIPDSSERSKPVNKAEEQEQGTCPSVLEVQ